MTIACADARMDPTISDKPNDSDSEFAGVPNNHPRVEVVPAESPVASDAASAANHLEDGFEDDDDEDDADGISVTSSVLEDILDMAEDRLHRGAGIMNDHRVAV